MRTRTWWCDQALAAAIVIATHLLIVLGLNRYLRPEPAAAEPAPEDALQVRFVPRSRPPAATPSPSPAPIAARPRRDTRIAPQQARPMPPAPIDIPADAAAPQARPLSAVYLPPAAPARPPPGMQTDADPFAKRTPRLPGAGATLGLPMREPMSAANAVEAVGKLFGGRSSPCPENRADIAALAAGGDRAALERAVDFERRYCRP
ncbi:hypothetical protein [Lysobacter silvisoli]|uniref:Uncharacterized protein n=1 Tax=Lysobacter silvisoli TaxID=2293254 RepID=A0A371K0L2_9GAMM|nr:hypothetical protein [Lysobacter silvisoli]RDZ27382.1 hypothetical protein DX914_14215 [Lysobacter silvisoli]